MAKTYDELKIYINSEITTKTKKGSITPLSHGNVLQEVVDFANENGGGSSANYSLIITNSADNTQPASAINEVYLNLVDTTNNEVVSSTKLINGESIYVSYNTITGLKVNVVTINPTHIDPDPDFENGIKVIESIITNSTGQVTGTRKKILPNKKYVDDAISSAIGDIGSALIFKGTLDNSITTETDTIKKNLPDNHKVGETWLVAKAGTYGGKTCEVGDMFVCTYTRTTANDNDWACIQANWTAIAGNENLQWNTSVTLATIGGVEVKAKLPQRPTTLTPYRVGLPTLSAGEEYSITEARWMAITDVAFYEIVGNNVKNRVYMDYDIVRTNQGQLSVRVRPQVEIVEGTIGCIITVLPR